MRRRSDDPRTRTLALWAAPGVLVVLALVSLAAGRLTTEAGPGTVAAGLAGSAEGAAPSTVPSDLPSGPPTATPTVTPSRTAPPAPAAPAYPPFPALGPSVAADYRPDPATAMEDEPDPYVEGCHQLRPGAEVVPCVYGDPASETVVVLVGDSHAAQWQPGLRAAAEARGWRLETYTKSACPLADADVWIRKDDQPYATCSAWNDATLTALVALEPDLVVTSLSGEYDAVVDGAMVPAGPEADALLAQGLTRTWSTLLDAGVPVAVLMDTPWYPQEVWSCLGAQPDAPAACDAEREAALATSALPILTAAAAAEPRVTVLDLTPALCGPAVCPAVVDGVLVMRDEHHLTNTYARTLGPWIGAGLDFALR